MIEKFRILSLALVISGLVVSCGPGEQKEAATEQTQTEQAAVINTTHAYICPMNCENSASMEPGNCKVCGMELVKNPNYAGAAMDSTAATDTTVKGEDTKDDAEHAHDDHEGHNH